MRPRPKARSTRPQSAIGVLSFTEKHRLEACRQRWNVWKPRSQSLKNWWANRRVFPSIRLKVPKKRPMRWSERIEKAAKIAEAEWLMLERKPERLRGAAGRARPPRILLRALTQFVPARGVFARAQLDRCASVAASTIRPAISVSGRHCSGTVFVIRRFASLTESPPTGFHIQLNDRDTTPDVGSTWASRVGRSFADTAFFRTLRCAVASARFGPPSAPCSSVVTSLARDWSWRRWCRTLPKKSPDGSTFLDGCRKNLEGTCLCPHRVRVAPGTARTHTATACHRSAHDCAPWDLPILRPSPRGEQGRGQAGLDLLGSSTRRVRSMRLTILPHWSDFRPSATSSHAAASFKENHSLQVSCKLNSRKGQRRVRDQDRDSHFRTTACG